MLIAPRIEFSRTGTTSLASTSGGGTGGDDACRSSGATQTSGTSMFEMRLPILKRRTALFLRRHSETLDRENGDYARPIHRCVVNRDARQWHGFPPVVTKSRHSQIGQRSNWQLNSNRYALPIYLVALVQVGVDSEKANPSAAATDAASRLATESNNRRLSIESPSHTEP